MGASTVAGESASAKKSKGPSKDASSFFAQQSGSTDRPQDRFEDAVDNSNSPFVHNFEHVGDLQVHSCPLPLWKACVVSIMSADYTLCSAE